MPIIER